MVWTYYHEHNLPITIVRPVNIYGPRSVTFVLDIVELLKSGGMVNIANGRKRAELAYVTNVVDVDPPCSADSESSVGQAYNASGWIRCDLAAVCESIGGDYRSV